MSHLRQIVASTIVKHAGNRVQRMRTEVSSAQMAQAIIDAWRQKFGSTPSKEQVAMILAQNDLETGHRKSMWNYNVGNITTQSDGAFDYFDDLTTKEQVSPGVWKNMNLKYRAYPTLEAGVKDYLNLLSSGRYAKSWQHILNPDPTSFSKSLKDAGYYTANEESYTKNLVGLFNKNYNSNNYELAMSGKVQPLNSTHPSTNKNDILKQYMGRMKNDMSIYDEIAQNNKSSNSPAVNNLLENYLQQITSFEKMNKKLYKKYLPNNHAIIRVASIDYVDAIEFARVLCSVLDEELVSQSFTHTDGKNVEVECTIPGPAKECFAAVEQFTDATIQAFKKATTKIGGVTIKTKLVINKKSHKDHLDLKIAETQHRKFLLKFM